jgi:hypothetical protein
MAQSDPYFKGFANIVYKIDDSGGNQRRSWRKPTS